MPKIFTRSFIASLTLTIAVVFFLIMAPGFALAELKPIEFTPEVPIPGVFDKTEVVDNDFIARYIRAVYIYFIWTVGILATVMIIYGGIKWVSAAGNPGRINDARESINNAVIGLIIALTSVLILNVINPDLVNLGLPDITTVQKKYYEGAAVVDVCPAERKVDCGQIQKFGFQIIDRNGARGDAFCMGTNCSDYTGRVCALESKDITPELKAVDDGGGYTTSYSSLLYPGGGCVQDVPVKQPAPGDYSPYSIFKTVDYQSGALITTKLKCGLIEADRLFDGKPVVGSACVQHTNWETCYVLNSFTEVIDNSGTNADNIRGMYCPE